MQYIIADKLQEANTFKRFDAVSARWITGEFMDKFVPSESSDFEGFPY